MKISIKLLSDLCSYSGETYNTTVDSDVVYDEYGLPYIPAKRIKGCIREAALELKEFGLIEHYDAIFGEKGNRQAAFTLSNAVLENRDSLVKAIKNFDKKSVVEPIKVLDEYTYTRTQTSVDYDTGVARETSLRTIRVVKKGLTFVADLDFKNNEYLNEFKRAVSIVKHMGVSRTRGLGLVKLEVIYDHNKTDKHVLFNDVYDKNIISYTILLKSKMICKSPMGNQAKSEDYIAGSKVLGLIAGSLGKEGYSQIFDKIIVSNAYIASNNNRCLPGRVSLQKIKDQKYVDGKMFVKDMLYYQNNEKSDVQRSPLHASYMSKDNVIKSVDEQITYHHQRPDDKSIGRATGSDGAFYQLGSLSEGQTFKGFIYCDKQVALKIKESVNKLGNVRMGYGRNSEFGSVDFTLDSNLEDKNNNELIHECDLVLASDTILYNQDGMLVADINALQDYLREKYVDDITISNPFLAYNIVGGFNVTWGRRKQTFNCLGKGSVVRLHSDKGFNGTYGVSNFIGERNSEGYGEYILEKLKDNDEVIVYKDDEDIKDLDCVADKDIINNLLIRECKKLIDEKVRDIVKSIKTNDDELNPAISKIRLLYRDATSHDYMVHELEQLDSSNKDKCLSLLKKVDMNIVNEAIADIKRDYKKDFDWKASDEDKFKYLYYAYIGELKNKVKIDSMENEND